MPPRLIRPKNDLSVADDGEAVVDSRSGKRKTVSSACIPCRKRKSKCDGGLPACSTCVAVYRTECSYDADSDHRRKGTLKRDLQSLMQQNDALDVIVASLRSLPEDESIALLHKLRTHNNPDLIANALRSNVRLPQGYGPQTLEADFVQPITPSLSSVSSERPPYLNGLSRTQSTDESQPYSPSVHTPTGSSGTWFTIPQDAEFIEHLLNLHFCWIHPFNQFVSRPHFMADMERGRTDFCSALLLNAILSFACHYSDRPMARRDPHDPSTAGDHFFAEAQRLLNSSEGPSHLTTVQALGIMSLRESSAGRDSSGYQYAGRCVRMALEMGLHLSVMKNGVRPPEAEMRRLVFWAVFNLETLCALAFGRLSQLPRSAADIELPPTTGRQDHEIWRPYEDAGIASNPNVEQPARLLLFQEQRNKLSEMASDMVNTFYAPRERFTSRRLAATYAQYQQWYRDLPEVFRWENTTLPHVLILHMYYYGCVLHLFRPYIKLDLSGANLYPRDTCTFCANEISSLMTVLRNLYGLRRISVGVITILLSASTIHLLNLPSESAAAHLSQGLHDLEAISVNHRFAARAIDIVRSLSSKWNIALPESAAAVAVYRSLGQLDVSSPPSSTFFAASISRNPSGESNTDESPFSPPGSHSSQQPAQHSQHTQQQPPQSTTPFFFSDPSTTLDTGQAQAAFWTPFPAQGMPIPHTSFGLDTIDHMSQFTTGPQWTNIMDGHGRSGEDSVGRQQSAPGRLDDCMGGAPEWSWH